MAYKAKHTVDAWGCIVYDLFTLRQGKKYKGIGMKYDFEEQDC